MRRSNISGLRIEQQPEQQADALHMKSSLDAYLVAGLLSPWLSVDFLLNIDLLIWIQTPGTVPAQPHHRCPVLPSQSDTSTQTLQRCVVNFDINRTCYAI